MLYKILGQSIIKACTHGTLQFISRQKPARPIIILSWVWVFALIVASHAPPVAAGSQCWVGELRVISGNIGIHSLGPYPDRDAILAAAKLKLDDLMLGKPYNDYCYPTSPPLPIISTYITCDWSGCDGDSCYFQNGVWVCTPSRSDRHIGISTKFASCMLMGDLRTFNDALSANPSPICAGSYTIRLSLSNNTSETASILTSIEPNEATNLVAKVYDQNNQLIPNVGVQLTLEAKKDSGGHHHPDDTVAARRGTMQGQQVLTGNTGHGKFVLKEPAPRLSSSESSADSRRQGGYGS